MTFVTFNSSLSSSFLLFFSFFFWSTGEKLQLIQSLSVPHHKLWSFQPKNSLHQIRSILPFNFKIRDQPMDYHVKYPFTGFNHATNCHFAMRLFFLFEQQWTTNTTWAHLILIPKKNKLNWGWERREETKEKNWIRMKGDSAPAIGSVSIRSVLRPSSQMNKCIKIENEIKGGKSIDWNQKPFQMLMCSTA